MSTPTSKKIINRSAFIVLAFLAITVMAGETTLVSLDSLGNHSDDGSVWQGEISADGHFVAYTSDASNLVSGDTNNMSDIFIFDRQTKQTTRVSILSDGTQLNIESFNPSISADGRFVAFASGGANVFVHDRQTKHTDVVSVSNKGMYGNDFSYAPKISGDGRFVAFMSRATNLVDGDTNFWRDIFVHDRLTKVTSLVSTSSGGLQANDDSESLSISADGRYVAFESRATNLVDNDTNGFPDVFMHDRQTKQTTRVSIASNGVQGNGNSGGPELSADGRFVAFYSVSNNLVGGDSNGWGDVFVHDRQTKQTTRVSISSSGVQGNDDSGYPSISSDGRFVAFGSISNNLVIGDTNDQSDVFVHDRQTKLTSRISLSVWRTQGNYGSSYPSISANGRLVSFISAANNLIADDTNGFWDIFVHEMHTADLKVTTVSAPTSLKLNEIGTYQFAISNLGPDVVDNIKLTHTVLSGAQVLSITPSQGSCLRFTISSCQLGKLLPSKGNSLSLTVVVKATQNPLTQSVKVTGTSIDSVPQNNQVTVSTEVLGKSANVVGITK